MELTWLRPGSGSTIARSSPAVVDTGYKYTLSAALTQSNPMVLDSGTSPIQQWNKSANLPTSIFNMAPNGSNWTLSPNDAPTKCLDAEAATNATGRSASRGPAVSFCGYPPDGPRSLAFGSNRRQAENVGRR